jgi:hypothetical protein
MTLDDIDRIEAGAVEVVANRLDSIAEAQQRVARSIGASGGQTCREAAVLLRSYARALAAPATQAAAPEVRGEALENAYAEFEGVPAKELAETVARYGKALRRVAGMNDLSGVDNKEDVESAALNALYECEMIAREAIGDIAALAQPIAAKGQ